MSEGETHAVRHGYVGPAEREQMMSKLRQDLEEKRTALWDLNEQVEALEREVDRLEASVERNGRGHAMLIGVEALDRWADRSGPIPQNEVEQVRCAVLAKDEKRSKPDAAPIWQVVDAWCQEWQSQMPAETVTLSVTPETIQTVREYLLPAGKLSTRP